MSKAQIITTPEADQKLLFVADSGSQIELRRALDLHPDINARDPFDYHRTALMKAARVGDFGGLMLLLRRGAAFDLKDDHGESACDLTTSRRIKRCLRLVMHLARPEKNHSLSRSHDTRHGERLGRVKTPGLTPRFGDKSTKKSKGKGTHDKHAHNPLHPSV